MYLISFTLLLGVVADHYSLSIKSYININIRSTLSLWDSCLRYVIVKSREKEKQSEIGIIWSLLIDDECAMFDVNLFLS